MVLFEKELNKHLRQKEPACDTLIGFEVRTYVAFFFYFDLQSIEFRMKKNVNESNDDVDGFMTFYQFQKSSYLIFIAPQKNLDFVSDSFKNSPIEWNSSIPTHLMLWQMVWWNALHRQIVRQRQVFR